MTFNVSPGVYSGIVDFVTGERYGSGGSDAARLNPEGGAEPGTFAALVATYPVVYNFEFNEQSGNLVSSVGGYQNTPLSAPVHYNSSPLLHPNQSSSSLIGESGSNWNYVFTSIFAPGVGEHTYGIFINFKNLDGDYRLIDVGNGNASRDGIIFSNPSPNVLRITLRGDNTVTFDYNNFKLETTYFFALVIDRVFTSNDSAVAYINGTQLTPSADFDPDGAQTTTTCLKPTGGTIAAVDNWFLVEQLLTQQQINEIYEAAGPFPTYIDDELFPE